MMMKHTAAPGGRKRIAVIGAGFSGTLTTTRLLQYADSPVEICLIEREEGYRYGGIAFGEASTTWDHMLNIQAGRITLRREHPEDFLEWANDEADRSSWPQNWRYHVFGISCVVPRRIFRQYLAERLRRAAADAHHDVTLTELAGDTIDVRAEGDGYAVTYVTAEAGGTGSTGSADGMGSTDGMGSKDGMGRTGSADGEVLTLHADYVVLATGHLAPVQRPFYHRLKHSDRFIADPYAPGAQAQFRSVAPDETVLVAGSALSAFDAVVSLVNAGHTGQIVISSRGGHMHGTYPTDHQHDIWQARRPPFLDAADLTPETVVEGVRAEYAHLRELHGGEVAEGVFAERVMKAWEPYVIELVSRMDAADVRMLLDRYKSLIVTNRTSTVQEIGGVVRDRMRGFNGAARTVTVNPGHLLDMCPAEGGTKVRVVFADQPDLLVDRVVNCLGNNTDYDRAEHPLWDGLVHGHKYARPQGKTHRGIEVGEHGQLVSAAGTEARGLFGVGPMRQGDETTRRGRLGAFVFSIGTLRNQCFDTATEVLRRLRHDSDGELVNIPDGVHHCLVRSTDWLVGDLGSTTGEVDTARLRERVLGFARETAYPNALNYLQAYDKDERRKYRGILEDDLARFGDAIVREFDATADQARRLGSMLSVLVERHAVQNLCDITRLADWRSQYADQVAFTSAKDA
ncbi:FAD/NAD(P)-binding protein [Kitasatospora sp. NPDC093558]|uniref:FAD/NAD(P)-binding protein n=1 Tax=Kitasatospora sp. NPDC093558 TaxID=3155201 RepID=UPI00342CF2B5